MLTYPIASALLLLVLMFPAAADTLVMKDGSKLQGSILREDATTYLLEVNVTRSIKDERVIAKADVRRIEHESPDQTAFAVIGKLTPTPDFLTAAEYAQRIRAVEKFLADYRMTATAKEAKVILATLKAEANEILAGGIKLNGKIVPTQEYTTNAYDIDGCIQAAKIRKLVNDSLTLQALRAFSGFDKDFRNTTAYTDLVPLMQQVITSYMAETVSLVKTFAARVKERNVGLERMPAADRRSTEKAIREENAELATRFKKEQDAKLGWVTIHPFFQPSLEDTVTFAQQELARLAAGQREPAVDGGMAFCDAMTLIQNKGEAAAITSAINAAKAAMVPPRYLAILDTASRAAGVPPVNP